MRCPWKIHTGAPSLGDLSCRLDAGHEGDEHEARGLFEHQTVTWLDGDRRQFTGDFFPCSEGTCTLPADHKGNHAS